MRKCLYLLLFLPMLQSCAYYFGNSWQHSYRAIQRTEIPAFQARPERRPIKALQQHPLVQLWANKQLLAPSQKEKSTSPRVLLAKLVANKDVAEVNRFLLNSAPWGNSGTSSGLNPKGDYDFTTILLSAILFQFEKDTSVLWPTTATHIAEVLLIEEGGKPHTKAPRMLGIMKDTENHILMTNISQYLKNQWMFEHGKTDIKFNNLENGLENFLLHLLDELQTTGPYEFNSKPYEGYTISALLVLQGYAHSENLKQKATQTLDGLAWEYWLTSFNFRKNSAYRRRFDRANKNLLTDNAMSSMMKTWFLQSKDSAFETSEIKHNQHQAFAALVLPYRPPIEFWINEREEKLVAIGHGRGSSPEIHSTGKGFMLSDGGFQRGRISQIIARPIVLLLDDGEQDLNNCFHIAGKGKMRRWNNTGVHHRLAVGVRPVHIPNQFSAVDSIGNWKLFRPIVGMNVITYSEDDFGLIYLPKRVEQDMLKRVVSQNGNPRSGQFQKLRGEKIRFNQNAGKGKWVIKQAGAEMLRQKTDTWKRVSIRYYPN